mmetsp:Transcript_114641/g.365601  ORF Transcript_114641/g.365601 Transcript_114641/m.365601 type:complete len:209 (+) Transcript_114641:411-1037(+)
MCEGAAHGCGCLSSAARPGRAEQSLEACEPEAHVSVVQAPAQRRDGVQAALPGDGRQRLQCRPPDLLLRVLEARTHRIDKAGVTIPCHRGQCPQRRLPQARVALLQDAQQGSAGAGVAPVGNGCHGLHGGQLQSFVLADEEAAECCNRPRVPVRRDGDQRLQCCLLDAVISGGQALAESCDSSGSTSGPQRAEDPQRPHLPLGLLRGL